MPKRTKWFEITNDAGNKSSAVMIYDKIGKSWTGDDGIAAKDFKAEMDKIPSDHEIKVNINSRGGNVWDGMAIYGMLQNRKSQVTCCVDGVAASIASVIAMAGKKTVMGKGALMMMHPPSALPMDSLNAAQARALADKLDTHAKAIAGVYAAKTGKTDKQMLDAMNSGETWMTAQEAKDAGYCDEISGDEATDYLNEAKNFDFAVFQKTPEPLRGQPTNNNTVMNKTEIVAFCKANGFEVAADASDEVIKATLEKITAKLKLAPVVPPLAAAAAAADPNALVTNLQAQVAGITAQLTAERKARIEVAVNALVDNCQLTAAEAPKAVIRAIADDTYLAELQARPQSLPGAAPINGSPAVYTKDDSVRNALKELTMKGVSNKGGEHAFDTSVDRSKNVQAIYGNDRDKIVAVMNAAANNSIDAGLKRVLILQETVRDFATRVLPVRMFSTVFENVPLQGTDTVEVPYYPLQAAASQNFVDGDGTGGTGYQFGQGTNTLAKLITVQTRKYQPLDYSSNNFRRQPWFDAVRLGRINAEKLGVDILLDILSAFTPANYPTIAQVDPNFNPNLALPGSAYDSNQIADLKTVATNLNWPDGGRSLIAGTTVDNALGKDPAYKLALNIGTTDVIQAGKFPRLSGFDYATMPNFPANGVNLQGLIAFASALAAAFAPIDPAAGVRQQLASYDIATDAATGVSMNHRHWGVAQADRDFEVIESAYGYAPILARAAQLLTHP